MSMNVTYKYINNAGNKQRYNNAACFSSFFSTGRKSPFVDVLLKWSGKNEKYKDFWIDTLMRIEPTLKVYKKGKEEWVSIKNKHFGRTKVFLTILRYLWEDDNGYDYTVLITKNIIDKYPEIDPFTAIVIASSTTKNAYGWGHSLVNGMSFRLPKIWHYLRFNGKRVYDLTTNHGMIVVKEPRKYINYMQNLEEIRKKMKDDYDINPIIKFYNLDKHYNKLKIAKWAN